MLWSCLSVEQLEADSFMWEDWSSRSVLTAPMFMSLVTTGLTNAESPTAHWILLAVPTFWPMAAALSFAFGPLKPMDHQFFVPLASLSSLVLCVCMGVWETLLPFCFFGGCTQAGSQEVSGRLLSFQVEVRGQEDITWWRHR